MALLKGTRTSAKRAVTKQINQVRQLISEEDSDRHSLIDEHVTSLKSLFRCFTEAHDLFHETLLEDTDIDQSEIYFGDKQNDYIATLELVKAYKRSCITKTDSKDNLNSNISGGDISRGELLRLINLPKVELEVFDGDPLHYHQFIHSFDANVDKLCNDDDLKLSRLMQYTAGAAKDAIRSCQLVGGDIGYSQARSILDKRFGNPHLVTEMLIRKLKIGKSINSPRDIQQFADDLQSAQLVLSQLKSIQEVNSQYIILELINRLPNYIQLKWKRYALEHKRSKGSYPLFKELVEFVDLVAGEENDPVYGNLNIGARLIKREQRNPSNFSVNVTDNYQSAHGGSGNKDVNYGNHGSYAKPEPPCVLCEQPHRLWHCDKFKGMRPNDRLSVVINYRLCHNCLLASHSTNKCGKRSVCAVQGCGKKHSMYIHCDGNASVVAPVKVANTGCFVGKGTYMPIVQVTVNQNCKVFALLDTGSSNSFCSRALMTELKLKGKRIELKLRTLNGSETMNSEIINLSLSSNKGDILEMSSVHAVDDIPVQNKHINGELYAHFSGIGPMPAYQSDNVIVDLLIGQDYAEALVPLEVRRGNAGQPFAVHTMFGWCVYGQVPVGVVSRDVISNFIMTPIHDDVSRLWDIENEGIEQSSWSHEDKKVIALWDLEHKKVDGHYEIPIPWRNRLEPLPNNFVTAKHRLDALCKRLVKDDTYEKYNAEITKLVVKGYAEEVPHCQLYTMDRIWYLPHHAVVSDKKPGKLRVVFDCASKFKGKSLNDRCMQGPDMINKLLPVLLRFRQHSFAIQADIEAMYHQVRIPLKDRDALRFIWYVDDQLVSYRMTSHLFGGVWCASSSAYALRRTVLDYPDVDPLIKVAVDQSFYVDDCISSVATMRDAKTIIHDTPKVLRSAGFILTKFVVNDKSLLKDVAVDCRAVQVCEFGSQTESCALGIKWKVSSDDFFFEFERKVVGPLSRRIMLSIVSSIFDPLGLIGPVVLSGKLLFQEATARRLTWDETVSTDLQKSWNKWFETLGAISHLRVPRCIKPRAYDNSVIELHHFSDASSKAYGCCSYIRCINKLGVVHVQLIMSKNKVAPLKLCTIPRLELQAAVLAVKVDSLLKRELDLEVIESYFWTDSEIVLKYIRNDSKRFHVFVGNRVSVIREFSDPSKWFYTPTAVNPADLVTRENSCIKLESSNWFYGPDKLRQFKSEWHVDMCEPHVLANDDPEVRNSPDVITCDVTSSRSIVDTRSDQSNGVGISDDSLYVLMSHYSSWYIMKRALAWWLRFFRYIRGDISLGGLSVDNIRLAGDVLLRKSQSLAFSSEIECLSKGKSIKVSSSIKELMPYLDKNGILRVGGRLRESDINNKHPCIISGSCVIALAIVRDIHGIAHVGVEWVLGITRKHFWIVKARPLIKRVIRACVTCKRLYAKPSTQLMADLPVERIQANKPPFTNIGIDVFGPFYVKHGRSEVKRYGCLFTCLCIRAIHVEKLDSLDTESFLNAFRRFVARRGEPEVVFSDNGTNFVGGVAQLKSSMNELSKSFINAYCVKRDMVWKFNPPHASHMGGVWERMIGVFKRIMAAILPRTVRLTDEILATIFCECESIVNSRPLVKLGDDASDHLPLTPNHFLLLKNDSGIPPGLFDQADSYRRRWRHVQHIANQFWRKWLRLYLPLLQKRSKWLRVSRNLAIGDLVLVLDEMTPRNLWPLALVVDVNRGRDDLVRSVRIKTKSTVLVRPITKVVLLEAVCST